MLLLRNLLPSCAHSDESSRHTPCAVRQERNQEATAHGVCLLLWLRPLLVSADHYRLAHAPSSSALRPTVDVRLERA